MYGTAGAGMIFVLPCLVVSRGITPMSPLTRRLGLLLELAER